MNEAAIQWLDGALMDLRNIEKIMDDAFLTPVACFHSQQCVEKALKGVLENFGLDVPKTHDLVRLYALVSENISTSINTEMLQTVSDLYIETRYPGDSGLMVDGKPTLDDVREFYEFAKDVYQIIEGILQNT